MTGVIRRSEGGGYGLKPGLQRASRRAVPVTARCYNVPMQWRQIERWATIAIYVSAGVGLAILLVEALAPAGSAVQQLAQITANRLTRLGEIGGGPLFAVVLAYLTTMGGTWIMVLLMEGIERLRTRRARTELRLERMREEVREEIRREEVREEIRKEVREEVREEIRELGREEMKDLIRERLERLGLDIQMEPERRAQIIAEAQERGRLAAREYLAEHGINPDNMPLPENPEPPPTQ